MKLTYEQLEAELTVTRGNLAECFRQKLQAEADLNVQKIEMHRYRDKWHVASAELTEIKESWPRLIAGDCAPDEKHCTCVPALRLAAQELQRKLAEKLRPCACGTPGCTDLPELTAEEIARGVRRNRRPSPSPQSSNEVEAAMEAVRMFQSFRYPTGHERAELCQAAIVLDKEVRRLRSQPADAEIARLNEDLKAALYREDEARKLANGNFDRWQKAEAALAAQPAPPLEPHLFYALSMADEAQKTVAPPERRWQDALRILAQQVRAQPAPGEAVVEAIRKAHNMIEVNNDDAPLNWLDDVREILFGVLASLTKEKPNG